VQHWRCGNDIAHSLRVAGGLAGTLIPPAPPPAPAPAC
jgi:hypothetical protein